MSTTPVKKRSTKAGLPAGTLIHLGERKTVKTSISITCYDEKDYEERTVDTITQCIPLKEKPAVAWINVEGIHQTEIIEKLGSCFNLHPLLLEDMLATDQRPKIEDRDDYIFIVLRMIYLDSATRRVVNEQVSLILGPNYVLSLQEGREGDVFNPIREQIRSAKSRIRKLGPDYLAYALLDAVVDGYFAVLENFGEQIETYEEAVSINPQTNTLQGLHLLRRDLIFLRKSLWPLREVINGLERYDSTLIAPTSKMYLKDVYDHIIQQIDTTETYRDMLTAMLDVYLSSISNRINEVMKVLTIIATIFIPLTFLAGVYGMNFAYFPELHWRYGYPIFWFICALTGIGMLFFFRRKRWI
ncbi:MAG: magnesium/cobalt transporter CorA [Phycisphaerae bacterium]